MIRGIFLFVLIITVFACSQPSGQLWKESQLMAPANLAKMLNDTLNKKPLLYSIGFSGGIKGSVELGPAAEKENLEKFKSEISNLDRNAEIIIYCGCCPFENCPNIRPAFSLLNELKFTNHKLLNLSENLKVDWIDKGYPVK